MERTVFRMVSRRPPRAIGASNENDRFYVNIYTKKSQWDKPTEPVYPTDGAPAGPPPGYAGSGTSNPDQKSTNPFDSTGNQQSTIETDAQLAARLQAEEDAQRSRGVGGNAFQDYQNTPISQQNSGYQQQNTGYQQQGGYPQQLPEREQKKSGGLLGKLLGKASGAGSSHKMGGGGGMPFGGGHQQQGGYGGYPQQQHGYGGGYGQQGYGQQGYGQQGYGQQGYGQQGMMGRMGGGRPQKSGGMGAGGAAALGVGGGLMGGMLLANAMDNNDEQEAYQDVSLTKRIGVSPIC